MSVRLPSVGKHSAHLVASFGFRAEKIERGVGQTTETPLDVAVRLLRTNRAAARPRGPGIRRRRLRLPAAVAGGEVTAAAPAISFYALCAADPAAWMAADAVLMIPFLRDIMRKWQ